MRNKHIVIYDKDAFYATRLEHFLSEREGNYFEISSFSERSLLEAEFGAEGKSKPEILLVSESSFFEDIKDIGAKNIFILNETGLKRLSEFVNFNKYQSAEVLLQQILLEYAERAVLPEPCVCQIIPFLSGSSNLLNIALVAKN